MKLSYKTVDLSVRTFDLFMYIQYQMELGNPVINDLNKIKNELSDKYEKDYGDITEETIKGVVKCSGKLFLTDLTEGWSRIQSSLICIVGKYIQAHSIDKLNFQEYLVQNLEEHNHSDKIPLVLSEIENIPLIIEESMSRYEKGIKFNKVQKSDNPIVSDIKKKHDNELYNDLMKGSRK